MGIMENNIALCAQVSACQDFSSLKQIQILLGLTPNCQNWEWKKQ